MLLTCIGTKIRHNPFPFASSVLCWWLKSRIEKMMINIWRYSIKWSMVHLFRSPFVRVEKAPSSGGDRDRYFPRVPMETQSVHPENEEISDWWTLIISSGPSIIIRFCDTKTATVKWSTPYQWTQNPAPDHHTCWHHFPYPRISGRRCRRAAIFRLVRISRKIRLRTKVIMNYFSQRIDAFFVDYFFPSIW